MYIANAETGSRHFELDPKPPVSARQIRHSAEIGEAGSGLLRQTPKWAKPERRKWQRSSSTSSPAIGDEGERRV